MSAHFCAAGTLLRRTSPYKELNWTRPCENEVEHDLPFNPPMWFCDAHFQVVVEDLLSSPLVWLSYADPLRPLSLLGYVVTW